MLTHALLTWILTKGDFAQEQQFREFYESGSKKREERGSELFETRGTLG